jgi:4-hydroxybenzoate polyprenyltransferase
MLRDYLLLIRAPNLFTVPSNIFVGYFAIIPTAAADSGQLLSLILSSIFLYVSGIVLNDYFDLEIDRKERPNRPLASGRITKRNAMILAVVSIIAGNVFAMTASWASLLISAMLTSVIIAYDFRLKRSTVANPISMGLARFLNIVLGGSPALGMAMVPSQGYTLLVFIGYCLFIYTAAISILSRKEISSNELFSGSNWITIFLSLSIVLVVIGSISVVGLDNFQSWFVFNLVIFSCVMVFAFLHLIMNLRDLSKKTREIKQEEKYKISLGEESQSYSKRSRAAQEIQTTIKIMILSIVILDSVFISGLVGIIAGMAILMLLVPPILLGRRLYVT